MAEERKYITIDQLIESAPKVISKSTLGNLKQSFEGAKHRAENCEMGKMVDNLLFIGQGLDEVVDEMAFAFRKGTIESADYDVYIKKIEEFQWGTVTKTIKDILLDKCKCGVTEISKTITEASKEELGELYKKVTGRSPETGRIMGK